MNTTPNNEKYILLDNLFNLFLDTKVDQDDKEHNNSKKDIDQVIQKNIMLFRQLKIQSKAELNTSKHNRALAFIEKLRAGVNSNIEQFKKIAEDIFSKPKFAELQPMFRNLSNVSEQDKQSILMDSKLLDLLDEIEEEYNKTDNEQG